MKHKKIQIYNYFHCLPFLIEKYEIRCRESCMLNKFIKGLPSERQLEICCRSFIWWATHRGFFIL